MRTVDEWFSAYGESHQHPVNKALHWVCIPLITTSLLGLLWAAPAPCLLPLVNWATALACVSVAYYTALSPRLALGMAVAIVGMLAAVRGLAGWEAAPLWCSSLVIFAVAWVGQFIGHAVEGKRPSFFADLQFLAIGPLWLLGHVYRKLGLRY